MTEYVLRRSPMVPYSFLCVVIASGNNNNNNNNNNMFFYMPFLLIRAHSPLQDKQKYSIGLQSEKTRKQTTKSMD